MLIGHDEPWRVWREALAGERLHHAWLLTGRKGLGKASFALAAARELIGAPAGEGEHPDILTLTHGPKDDKEDKKRAEGKPYESARSIRIAQVRAMQQRLNTRPTLGERRAIVIDPADDLERNAANALLKSLEEPPKGTYFLLVAHRPARLLPTIRSRCRVLRFADLPASAMARVMAELAPQADAPTREAAIAAASGSPGAALGFVTMDLAKVAGPMRALLAGSEDGMSVRGRLADAIGARPDRERVQAVLDLARALLSERLADHAGNPGAIVAAHADLVRLSGEAPTYNYDPGLLALEIGRLLAGVGAASSRANV